MRLVRALKIFWVLMYFGLDQMVVEAGANAWVLRLWSKFFFWRHFSEARGIRLRKALETLGPIFVKFGQMLSTRRDLLPPDIANELALLQDRVPPFSSDLALHVLAQCYGKPASEVFEHFEHKPVASASVAQVHAARLPGGIAVAVKIQRPGIEPIIQTDMALLAFFAKGLEWAWSGARRLKPREVVAEFSKYLRDELDLMREAASCSQLRRNFADSALLKVPEVYWDYCANNVMVMEWMNGTPISQLDVLRKQGVNLSRLSAAGVEIFFTQVFRDGFFHADMHPGNIFVSADGHYIALDFGIMGTLTDIDKNYLAQNFLAFFKRDYKRVAQAHIEAGWVPANTRIDEFEAAIRTVCEPIFDRPLKDISFGKTLLRLFQTAHRFEMEVQPQLVLLQKTLLNIEGLGRQLDPDLDLWKTAKPFLERWMSEQIGWGALRQSLEAELPGWGHMLPQIPRLVHQHLLEQNHAQQKRLEHESTVLKALQRQFNLLLLLLLGLILGVIYIAV